MRGNDMQITKNELRERYYAMKNIDLCKELGITVPTLLSYLKKHSIPLKGKGNHQAGPKPKIEIVE